MEVGVEVAAEAAHAVAVFVLSATWMLAAVLAKATKEPHSQTPHVSPSRLSGRGRTREMS